LGRLVPGPCGPNSRSSLVLQGSVWMVPRLLPCENLALRNATGEPRPLVSGNPRSPARSCTPRGATLMGPVRVACGGAMRHGTSSAFKARSSSTSLKTLSQLLKGSR
jgi:hypothetical protein